MKKLPNEIWLKVFKYLSTYDILVFCDAFEVASYFLRDKNIISNFNVGGNFYFYNINLYTYISENVGYHFIMSLNINRFYWIPLDDIRRLIKLLPKLEELYALDTKLSIREKDVKLYGKLRTLAISVEASDFTADSLLYQNNMYLLKKLCLKVIKKSSNFQSIYTLFKELVALDELWINDTDDSITEPIKYDYIVYSLKFLKKLVIKSKVNIPFLDYKPFRLAKVFETRRFRSIVMCYVTYPREKIIPIRDVSLFEPLETSLEEAWDVLRRFRCEMPCGMKDSKTFYMTKQIRNIQFEELNFYHNRCFCNPSFIKAVLNILKSENCEKLQKLSMRSCILQNKQAKKEQTVQNLHRVTPFKEVVENCPFLKELELMACPNCNSTILEGYPLISEFKNLRKLTVEVPVYLHGKFLIDVLQKCVKLKSLTIISLNTNENLNRFLYAALPFGTALEDFSFENRTIDLKKLFTSINQMTQCYLRRIFVKCIASDAFSNYSLPLKTLLENNPQIIFLYLAVTKYNRPTNSKVQEFLNVIKKDNPAKIYICRTVESFTGNFPVPETHRDLLCRDTTVSVIDFYSFR